MLSLDPLGPWTPLGILADDGLVKIQARHIPHRHMHRRLVELTKAAGPVTLPLKNVGMRRQVSAQHVIVRRDPVNHRRTPGKHRRSIRRADRERSIPPVKARTPRSQAIQCRRGIHPTAVAA